MVNSQSKFEQIIDDVRAFQVMLDGVFRDWNGSYEVLLADTNTYLFTAKNAPNFRPFCRLLRSNPAGEMLCKHNDQIMAEQFHKNQEDARIYVCHAGLIDVAIPIRIGSNLIATVFCGQVRPADPEKDQQFYENVKQLERQHAFVDGELIEQARQVPQISLDEINVVIERAKVLVGYVSRLGSERLQAQRQNQQRLEAIEKLHSANRRLNTPDIRWDDFWLIVQELLEQVTGIIGAACALILLPGTSKERRGKHVVTAVAGLPVEAFKAKVYALTASVHEALGQWDRPRVIDVDDQVLADGPVRKSVAEYAPEIAELGKEIVISMSLEKQPNGLLIFFFNEGSYEPNNLIEEARAEIDIVKQLADTISNAFNNRRQHRFKQTWLATVTHQLIGPLSAVQGHAELLQRRLDRWQDQNDKLFYNWDDRQVDQFRKSLEAIVRATNYVSRLAYNFAQAVYEGKELGDVEFTLEYNMVGMLIQVARDFQASASAHGKRVTVDEPSISLLNGRVKIIRTEDRFRQAVGNLIDNAVKYSFSGTTVLITGRIEDDWGIIDVINEGIQLAEGEEEKIFIYEYRTDEARRTNASGTGIGLPVARKYIEDHGGALIAYPSVPGEIRDGQQVWYTTFTIRLPLI